MVDVLIATYNGERFLAEQIESILKQTWQDFRILIHDDGSTDKTVEIIDEFVSRYPDKMIRMKDTVKCGSAVKNFMHLSQYSEADYIMYCDQDDYWLPNKIELTLAKMQELETKAGKDIPILVFSTYALADENLKLLSYKEKNMQIASCHLELSRLVVQNYVTGCLMMVNKRLLTLAGEYHEGILMHDWWFALIASAMGEICHIKDVTMLYRQHTDNVVGAIDVKSFRYRWARVKDKNTKNMKFLYKAQMQLFLNRFQEYLNEDTVKVIDNFLAIYEEKSKLKRVYKLLKGNYTKSDFVRVVGQLWYV